MELQMLKWLGGVSPMKSGRYEIHEFDVLPSYKVLECDWNMIREESSRCPICSLCPSRPLKINPRKVLDSRYGWGCSTSLRWLARVQKHIWVIRYLHNAFE